MGDMRNVYKIVVEISERKNHMEDLDIDGKITIERILG
jgi:hypothetical protein